MSHAELEAVLSSYTGTLTRKHITSWFRTDKTLDANTLMQRLGGTIKIVELVGAFDEEQLSEWLYAQVDESSKFHFGFSLYAFEHSTPVKKHWKTIHALGLSLKKSLKADGISCRYVQSRDITLSSVIVHKERLLKNGVEIVLLKGEGELLYGKTLAVQPFQDFSKRDYGRPARDTKSGMLPPKLARMLVNLSQPQQESIILDPFCGSGTILQEALLMGYTQIRGSDKSKKAIADTRQNLEWMEHANVPLQVVDARFLTSRGNIRPASVDRIVFEGYLGQPSPPKDKIQSIANDLQRLYAEAMKELAKVLTPDGVIVAALPFWSINKKETHLDTTTILRNAGLTQTQDPLLYRRPQSTVGREIMILKK